MIDDDLLMAFLDGELDEMTRVRVERALAADADLRARLDVQHRLRARLAAHYGPAIEEEVPARFRAMLDSNVVPFRRARPLWQTFAALAATLVLGLALGSRLPAPGGPVGIEKGQMVAQGTLADALETQLASAQGPGAATRIGVTFADADGRLCRTFEGEVSGLACRGDQGWQLMMTGAGAHGQREGYRQAASGDPRILAAAQEMMAGEPLDAAAERRARDRGWRGR
jgi:hypothetical protein